MTPNPSTLDSIELYSVTNSVIVGNGDNLFISHIGSRHLSHNLCLLNVLVVPSLKKNLVSISRLTRDYPVDVKFANNSFIIQKLTTGQVLARGKHENELYMLEQGEASFISVLHSNKLRGSFQLWHSHLGHVMSSLI